MVSTSMSDRLGIPCVVDFFFFANGKVLLHKYQQVIGWNGVVC